MKEPEKLNERYNNLDGLRVISCLCIVVYHIKKFSHFQLGDGVAATIIDSWTQFVPLFLMISGFGIFCGYYDRMKSGSVDIVSFYKKRYLKILPFFSFILLIDIVMDFSVAHLIEVLTSLTLVYGLLPNYTMDVCAVGWTLGVIFVFYITFPFIVSLCSTKRKAIVTFAGSILLSIFCSEYFVTAKFVINDYNPRRVFLYCAPFFIGGGVIYLYRYSIKNYIRPKRTLCLTLCFLLSIIWYAIPSEIQGFHTTMLRNLVVFSAWLCYAISVESKVLNNRLFNHLSKISLELYLAQMIIFRGIEKIFGLYFAGNGYLGYIVICAVDISLLILFVEICKHGERIIKSLLAKNLL